MNQRKRQIKKTKAKLTHRVLREILDYNKDSGIFTYKKHGWENWVGRIAGSVNTGGHLQIYMLGKLWNAGRLAWFYTYKRWPAHDIDHINRIKTDNRIQNLRDVTRSFNIQNQGAKGKVPFIGVSVKRNSFIAQIARKGDHRYIGSFPTAELAAQAYDFEARKEYGVLASVNFPIKPTSEETHK